MRILKYIFLFLFPLLIFLLSTHLTIHFLLQREEEMSCPKIEGVNLQEARKRLEKMDLFLEVTRYERREDMPDGTIISQSPKEGSSVRKRRRIQVVVSKGPKYIVCPDLLGKNIEEAEAILKEKDLRIEKILRIPFMKENIVLAQIPSPFENIREGEGVKLFMGIKELRYYCMPKIDYENLEEILKEMEEKGIKYKISYERGENYGIIPSVEISKKSGQIISSEDELIIKVGMRG